MGREKVWVVRAGDGATVGEIVARAREDASALRDGRVFLGKRRVERAEHPVKVGDVVRIGAAAPRAKLEVVFRGDGLLACAKPAGLPTVPDHAGAAHSLVALAAAEVGCDPKDVRVTSRLDRDVSGVVVFALDADAEARLVAARAAGGYHRRYVAIAGGALEGGGVWDVPIGRAASPLLRRANGEDAKAATTRWRAIARASGFTVLALDPITGRTHQLRVHASAAGAPLLGDRDYAGAGRVVLPSGAVVRLARVALHAARVTVPTRVREVTIEAAIPRELTDAWRDLGGAPEAWEEALAAPAASPGR